MEPGTASGSHGGSRLPANEIYSGVQLLRHTEGDALRQHTGKVEKDAGAGRDKSTSKRRGDRAGLLLRNGRYALQPTHQQVPTRSARIRRSTASETNPKVQVRKPEGFQVVVGVLQEAHHHIALLQQQFATKTRIRVRF